MGRPINPWSHHGLNNAEKRERGSLSGGKEAFLYVKEWVNYLLILQRRGVEISQRYGEKWSRSAQVFLIYASHFTHWTRRSQSRLMNPSKWWSLSTICTGTSVATNLLLRLDARSTATELLTAELRQSGQWNELSLGNTAIPSCLNWGCCITAASPHLLASWYLK